MRRGIWALVLLGACHDGQSGSLSGRVLIDGELELSGVTVQAVGPQSAVTETDANGHWFIAGLAAGDYQLLYSAADTRELEQVLPVHLSSSGTVAPDVVFGGVGILAGSASANGLPVPGVILAVDGADVVGVTDGAGAFRIERVPTGERTLFAWLTGYGDATQSGLMVRRGQVTTVDPLSLEVEPDHLHPIASLAGIAQRLDRSDWSGTMVTAIAGSKRYSTITAMDGSYRIDGLASGPYSLQFDYDGLQEVIPEVLALPGSTGQVATGGLFTLHDNPIQLPMARRVASGLTATLPVDDRYALAEGNGIGSDRSLFIVDLVSATSTRLGDAVPAGVGPGAVVLSSDKQRVLYWFENGSATASSLYVAAIDGSSAPVRLADSAYGALFVLHGTAVLFGLGPDLYTVPVGGGAPQHLATAVSGYRVLSDDRRIVYQTCAGNCRQVLQPLDGGNSVDLYPGYSKIQLSPDGVHFAYWGASNTSDSGPLSLGSFGGPPPSAIASDALFSYTLPFSEDGHYVYFTNSAGLFVAEVAGSAVPRLIDPVQNSRYPIFPSFSPDGRRALYYQPDINLPGNYRPLRQASLTGGSPVVLSSQAQGGPVFWPDATSTTFLEATDPYLYVANLKIADGNGGSRVVASLVSHIDGPTRDGTRLAYLAYNQSYCPRSQSACQRELWSVGVTGAPLKLGIVGDTETVQYAANRAAFADEAGLVHVVDMTTGAEHIVAYGEPMWIDDQHLLISTGKLHSPYTFQEGLYLWQVQP